MSYTVKRHSKNHTRHYKYVHIPQKDFIIRNVYCGQITYQKINYQKTRYTVRVTFAVKKHANTDIKHQIYAKSTLKYIRLNNITNMGGETDKITYKENSI